MLSTQKTARAAPGLTPCSPKAEDAREAHLHPHGNGPTVGGAPRTRRAARRARAQLPSPDAPPATRHHRRRRSCAHGRTARATNSFHRDLTHGWSLPSAAAPSSRAVHPPEAAVGAGVTFALGSCGAALGAPRRAAPLNARCRRPPTSSLRVPPRPRALQRAARLPVGASSVTSSLPARTVRAPNRIPLRGKHHAPPVTYLSVGGGLCRL
jgi:hypothetical protein